MHSSKDLIPDAIRAILFDLDGVIVDSEKLHGLAWIEIVKRYDVKGLTLEIYAEKYFGTADHDLAKLYFPQPVVDRVVNEKIDYFLANLEELEVSPAVHQFVVRCHQKYPMGVVTNCTRREGTRIVDAIGLTPYFRFIVTKDDVPRAKPFPDPYLRGFALLQPHISPLTPNDVLVIEDSEVGAHAAKEAGFVHVLHRPFDHTDIQATLKHLASA